MIYNFIFIGADHSVNQEKQCMRYLTGFKGRSGLMAIKINIKGRLYGATLLRKGILRSKVVLDPPIQIDNRWIAVIKIWNTRIYHEI